MSIQEQRRAKFEAWVRREWPEAPLHHVRDALPKDHPRYGEYVTETIQRAWVGWSAALDSVEIELPVPVEPECPEDAIDDSWMDAYNAELRLLKRCAMAIESATLKVKP